MKLFSHTRLSAAASMLFLAGCGDGKAPTAPSAPTSFFAGTWRGTVMIQPTGQPASTAATTWTFSVVPQTNQQTFNATIQSEHPWLPITTQAVASIAPSASPPTQIGTQGEYNSPRGCRGTLGSLGTAEATRIEATFHGADCGTTFDGTISLTKSGT